MHPLNAAQFDAILCSEVLEHVPEPTHAFDEFARLLKPGGVLIVTARFASNVHMAPYHYCTGFSRYWYEHQLAQRGFTIRELVPNGDWYALLRQEITRLGALERDRITEPRFLPRLYNMPHIACFRLLAKKSSHKETLLHSRSTIQIESIYTCNTACKLADMT